MHPTSQPPIPVSVKAERPAPITVFGILNIIFGVLGICGAGFDMLGLSMAGMTQWNPVFATMDENPAARIFFIIWTTLGGVAAIVLLVAGIGLLNNREWARVTSIGYAIYALIAAVAGTAISYVLLIRPLLEQADTSTPEGYGALAGAVGGLFGGCVSVVYPIFLLVFMTRPRVKGFLVRRASE